MTDYLDPDIDATEELMRDNNCKLDYTFGFEERELLDYPENVYSAITLNLRKRHLK
ncbi:MAG: hypothetical protein AABX16_04050 [Nanoarchaeota archaeon]